MLECLFWKVTDMVSPTVDVDKFDVRHQFGGFLNNFFLCM